MAQRLAVLVLLTAASLPWARCQDFHAGAITVDQARTGPSVAGQRDDPAFMTLSNYGKDDVLVGVTCHVASAVEMRAAIPAEQGTTERVLSSIPIPANSKLEFKQQGYHLAFVGLNYSFGPGDRIAATLRFASGLELPIEYEVDNSAGNEVSQK